MLVVRIQLVKKRKESKALASYIKRTSFEMFLCSNCKRGNKKCLVSNKENSGYCSECVLQGASCNVKGVLVSKQHALKAKEACLKAEKETAFRLVCENMSHIKCLKRQQEFLKSKGKDIVCRGLKTLNKLKEVKEREKQIKEERATIKATAKLSFALQAALKQFANPFAKIKILLLPLKVQANQDFASKTL